MNIVHINETTRQGGAALSMRRLHEGLLAAGHDSRMLVGWASHEDAHTAVVGRLSWADRIFYHGFNLVGLNYVGILNGRRFLEHRFVRNADIIHLHNLHGGYISYRLLPALARRGAVVWTLHDMWALTGHCGHSLDCVRWRTGCGRCPYPKLYPPIRMDATRLEWRLKRHVYGRTRMTVLCPSAWLTNLAREGLPDSVRVCHVPHGIDTERFRPMDRAACRESFALPPDKRVILLVAQSVRNPYKHAALLWEAVRGLSPAARDRTILLILGADGGGAENEVGGVEVREMGYLDDEAAKVRAYNAADVVAYPTRADNQPLVVMEALACGVPVVSTAVGGVPEMIRPGETGLLAQPGDADGFRNGLEEMLGDPGRRMEMGRRARAFAEREYGLKQWVRAMEAVYHAA